MASVRIEAPTDAQLIAGARLLADALRFEERDAVPPWLLRSAGAEGGVVLAALDADSTVLGFSCAIPALDVDGIFLSSCGLAVVGGHRREGIGRRLKLEQRRRATALGYASIRWTADPLSAPALGLYLSDLGARLTHYLPGHFDALRPSDGVTQDDVRIVWDHTTAGGECASSRWVEIPSNRSALEPAEQEEWRSRTRHAMVDALDSGLVGTRVERDGAAGRCWVRFDPACP